MNESTFWGSELPSPGELASASLELHWAARIVASVGQTFAEPRDDDSHRAMTWEAGLGALVGAPFAGPYPFRVAVRPADLTLVLLDRASEALGSLPLEGVRLGEAKQWLATGLATYMGGAPPLLEEPEFEIPTHPVGSGAPFGGVPARDRAAVAGLYGAAAAMLAELVSTRDDASPIRCWPHHFDIATLLTVSRDDAGRATSTVGVGMAPYGGGYDGWYWYVSPWPHPEPDALPPLDGPGAWHTAGWTGAVLPGESLAETTAGFRDPVVRKFLDVSVAAAEAALRATA